MSPVFLAASPISGFRVCQGSVNSTLPLAGGSAGLRWWRAAERANLQGGVLDCFNGRPGRVPLWLFAVGAANHFTLTSLRLDSPASERVHSTNFPSAIPWRLREGSVGE